MLLCSFFCWSYGFLGCAFAILLLEFRISSVLVCYTFVSVLDSLGARLYYFAGALDSLGAPL